MCLEKDKIRQKRDKVPTTNRKETSRPKLLPGPVFGPILILSPTS